MVLVFAVMHLYIIFSILLLLSIPFFFSFFYTSGIDNLTEGSTIPACPSLMCLYSMGNTEGANSSKMCLVFVPVRTDLVDLREFAV